MHELFYVSHDSISGSTLTFPRTELHHIRHVLRIGKGEEVWVTDGRGSKFRVVLSDPASGIGRILEVVKEDPGISSRFVIAFPVLRGARMDWAVEKLTELGVGSIQPYSSSLSVERGVKSERWRNVAIAAMKQSLRSYLPVFEPICAFEQLCDRISLFEGVVFADLGGAEARPVGGTGLKTGGRVLAIVGPEGGLSPSEKARLEKLGAVGLSLGNRRLRAETAAVLLLWALLQGVESAGIEKRKTKKSD